MDQELTCTIILEKPVPGVKTGLQKGSGNKHEILQIQQSSGNDLTYTFPIKVKTGKDEQPDFAGPFVHGPVGERFIYLSIGTMAGQPDSPWSRRLKVPLRDITWAMVQKAASAGHVLQTTVPGKGKDGTPSCATVKPFDGWKIK
ncbi:MAG: hypothetical protein J7621_08635 [Niastella sp.]|nr:hypothetical protein [Niastella sp.]